MATETSKYLSDRDAESRHSALAEFSRDERRPAVLLLSALVIAVIFFGLGLLIGRWTALPDLSATGVSSGTPAIPSTTTPSPQSGTGNDARAGPTDAQRRFAILVATYDAPEKSKPLIKTLQDAGYKDVRSASQRGDDARPRYSVLVGRYTQDEAREAVRRMRSATDPRLKNAKVVDGN